MTLPNTTPIHLGPPRVATRAVVSAANTNRDGTGTIVDLVSMVSTANPNGGRVLKLYVSATGVTTAGMLRLFFHDGSNWALIREDDVTAIAAPGATTKSFKLTITLNEDIPVGCKLGMSTHNAETFHVVPIVADY
jgi:hypothetical protein